MVKEMVLSAGRVTLVDDEDFGWLSQWKWTFENHGRTGYAYRQQYDESGVWIAHVRMHRVIMSPPADMVVDHINGDGLDNRRANLRICTRTQNLWNRRRRKEGLSLPIGVREYDGLYCARLRANGERVESPSYHSVNEAAAAYNVLSVEYHGEFGVLNDDVPTPANIPPSPVKRRGHWTSRFRGVSLARDGWRAEIRIKARLILLGYFKTEEDAAKAWNDAARKYRGDDTRVNET